MRQWTAWRLLTGTHDVEEEISVSLLLDCPSSNVRTSQIDQVLLAEIKASLPDTAVA
jgi:hypothetical protein